MSTPRELNLLSIVVSVFNEEEALGKFWVELSHTLSQINSKWEVLFVNDGSTDGTAEILKKLESEQNVKVLSFSRNFGHEAAMLAGIDHAKGDAVICMDADGENPPSTIPLMIDKFLEGFDTVNMVRKSRGGTSLYKKITSKLFYIFLNSISPIHFHINASDFFLISGRVAKILRKEYRERTRFIRGFIQSVGFKNTTVTFDPKNRLGGKSKYSFFKLIALSTTAIVSFSKIPLHLGLVFGFIFSIVAAALGIYSLVMWAIDDVPPGYTTLAVFIAFSFALLFFLIGIIGVYIGFLFEENKKRPIYILDEHPSDEN